MFLWMTIGPEQHQPSRGTRIIKLGQLSVRSEREDAVQTILVCGELDLATAGVVQDELERVEATDVRSIVVDLSRLTFMDSTGIRLLLNAQARSRADAKRLRLLRGPAAVQRALELTGVVDLLPFAD
jgi:anti-sigma B factor antagonist